ncbi:hypothetical protein Trydic_g3901 [Trypoxylus dichotomus]
MPLVGASLVCESVYLGAAPIVEKDDAHCGGIIYSAEDNPDFLDSNLIGDNTWCFKGDPETKRQSAQWKSKDEPKPQK